VTTGRTTTQTSQRSDYRWWQRGVFYQVYPRSFADGDGDGVGDLRGLTARLDHLAWLGVDAIWLSPIYPSPMRDFGYDITDHTDVDRLFGSLADLDRFVAEAHRLGLRVLLDYVPNHTSDQHPWFIESRADRRGPRRDWYLWRDPAPHGGPPTNWRSVFGGPAWTADPDTGQYYYHTYLPEQPDLNWRNPQVREAMLDVLRLWLDRGVDGFRIDALRHLLKDARWRDNPANPAYRPGMPSYDAHLPVHSADVDDVHGLIAAIRRVLDSHGGCGEERLLIGELYLPMDRLVRYYGQDGRGLQLPSNMHLIATAWHAGAIAGLVERYEAALPAGGWPNWVLGNHDRSRIASRVGDAQARVAAMLLLTLRGTPTMYYGDEIGMHDVAVPPALVRDPYGLRVPGYGRDPQRSPLQWHAGPNAGFCPPGTRPWVPIAADAVRVNIAAQRHDPRSMLSLHRRLLALRRTNQALAVGGYRTVIAGPANFAYLREVPGERLLVALNFTDQPTSHNLDGLAGHVLLTTHLDGRDGEHIAGELRLRPDEGAVIAVGD